MSLDNLTPLPVPSVPSPPEREPAIAIAELVENHTESPDDLTAVTVVALPSTNPSVQDVEPAIVRAELVEDQGQGGRRSGGKKTATVCPRKQNLIIIYILVILVGAVAVTIFLINNNNKNRQHHRPTSNPTFSPTFTPINDKKAIALGWNHTCSITNNKSLKCWGGNGNGQLGDGTIMSRDTPKTINLGYNVSPKKISTGAYHSCVITKDTRLLKCWGNNSNGQLGDNTTIDRLKPKTINLGNNVYGPVYATQVALGWFHTCVITSNRLLKCWGRNDYGQLGDGTSDDRYIPTTINLGYDVYPKQISSDGYHTCVITSNDLLKCWGDNSNGQLGDNTINTINSYTPKTINLGWRVIPTQLSLGGYHTCVITSGDSLKCWGNNVYGQLGDGTKSNRNTPKTVNLGWWVAPTHLSLGGYHTCVITSDDSLKCWGSNEYGQLGDGTKINRNTPKTINLDFRWGATPTHVSLGGHHTCIITSSKLGKCWGSNVYGQLGDGTRIDRKEPQNVID